MVTTKGKKQKAKYLRLTRRNAREICNARRDTLDEPAYQEPTVRNKAVVFCDRYKLLDHVISA